eukprot:416621-Prorocentrum_minimum.AAC.3
MQAKNKPVRVLISVLDVIVFVCFVCDCVLSALLFRVPLLTAAGSAGGTSVSMSAVCVDAPLTVHIDPLIVHLDPLTVNLDPLTCAISGVTA